MFNTTASDCAGSSGQLQAVVRCYQPLTASPAVVISVVHMERSSCGTKGRLCSTSVTLMIFSSSAHHRQQQ